VKLFGIAALLAIVLIPKLLLAQQPTDAKIRAELQRRIQPVTSITLVVQNGVVTLTGTLPSLAQKQSILNIVRRTIGVKEVVDRITVVPAQKKTDEELLRSVRSMLAGNLSNEEMAAITIRAEKGVIILTGTLTSSYPKQVAGLLASWAPGVIDVQNDIIVRPSKIRSDLAITADINARFRRNPFVEQHRINVTVQNGVVTLMGIVDNFFIADQAESVARFTPGVVDVHNLLFVRADGM
jgi:hyperosmotically inducible periplasmic protein